MQEREVERAVLRALVQRMTVASYLCEAWAAVLVGGLLVLSSSRDYVRWAWLALALAVAFWLLDAALLRLRGLYRGRKPETVSALMFSRSLSPFYGALIGVILLTRWVG
jgi:hypothetical protein